MIVGMNGHQLLREWRAKQGVSQMWIADKIGVAYASIQRFETGSVEPRASTAIRLEEATAGAVPIRSWMPEEVGS